MNYLNLSEREKDNIKKRILIKKQKLENKGQVERKLYFYYKHLNDLLNKQLDRYINADVR